MFKQVTDHFPVDYGGFILFPVSIFQLRGLIPEEQLISVLKTEAKKALNTSAFSSPFVMFSPPSKNKMDILCRLPFADNVFIETFLIVFYDSRQIKC